MGPALKRLSTSGNEIESSIPRGIVVGDAGPGGTVGGRSCKRFPLTIKNAVTKDSLVKGFAIMKTSIA
jgi:hypothetical protein